MAYPTPNTAYGVVLNTRSQLEAAGDLTQPPYKAPPRAPVLYIKPSNTFAPGGGVVHVPAGEAQLVVSATLAAVIGRTATRVSAADALSHVAGYALAIDVSVPHASLYRPAISQRCRDGFLPFGETTPLASPDNQTLLTRVNGDVRGRFSTAELIRPVAQLIADVTAFMTLVEGDMLLVGLPGAAPLAGAGDTVAAEAEGFSALACRLEAEPRIAA